jgi:hypothetical protein
MANVLWRDHRVGTVAVVGGKLKDKHGIFTVQAEATAIRINGDYNIKQIAELDIKFDPSFCELFGLTGVDTE